MALIISDMFIFMSYTVIITDLADTVSLDHVSGPDCSRDIIKMFRWSMVHFVTSPRQSYLTNGKLFTLLIFTVCMWLFYNSYYFSLDLRWPWQIHSLKHQHKLEVMMTSLNWWHSSWMCWQLRSSVLLDWRCTSSIHSWVFAETSMFEASCSTNCFCCFGASGDCCCIMWWSFVSVL